MSSLMLLRHRWLFGKKGTPQAPPAVSAEAAQFFARITDPGTARKNLYAALIDGLVADGVWPLGAVLQVYAADIAGNAVVNLKSASFTAVPTNTPTFTVDRGFTGNSVSFSHVNTGYNAVTAAGNYTQNAASHGVWSTTAVNIGALLGLASGVAGQNIFPKYSDGNTYIRVNDNPEAAGFILGLDAAGFFLGNRSGATAREGYRNKVSVGAYASTASQAPVSSNFITPALSPTNVSDAQVCAFWAGGSLNSTQQAALYDRLRAYMTGVGVP